MRRQGKAQESSVRNLLSYGKLAQPSRFEEAAMSLIHAKLDADGRLLIPAQVRRALGMPKGANVTMRFDNTGLHVETQMASIKRAQELLRQYIPAGVSLSDELIADRRAEVAKEQSQPGTSLDG
jgi:bifunctional DNA-binding transcriptional regulator/antitoxin component of YhaV-PrlF toxin-antitoxin module